MKTINDLVDPRKQNVTGNMVKEKLDAIVANGFTKFRPDGIFAYSVFTMIGDGEYGASISAVKDIMATALYTGDDLANYFESVAKNQEQKASNLEKKYSSLGYKVKKVITTAPDKIRLRFGMPTKRVYDFIVSDNLEKHSINESRIVADTYSQMAKTVRDMHSQIGTKDAAEIKKLVEYEHPFSGRFNRESDITFSNESIRTYGEILRQEVLKNWGSINIDYIERPLNNLGSQPKRC